MLTTHCEDYGFISIESNMEWFSLVCQTRHASLTRVVVLPLHAQYGLDGRLTGIKRE
jgi:hypothetical protein